jgi:hypothetical protein
LTTFRFKKGSGRGVWVWVWVCGDIGYLDDIIIEEKMAEVLMGNYNFSKIGKYISNKLHHIHKGRKETPRHALAPSPSAPSEEHTERS